MSRPSPEVTLAPEKVGNGPTGPLGVVAAVAIAAFFVLVGLVTFGPQGLGARLTAKQPQSTLSGSGTYENSLAATVRVYQFTSDGIRSGTAVAISDNELLTAAHVAADFDHVWIDLAPGEKIEAEVMESGGGLDLALLRTTEPHGLPAASLANGNPPVNDLVVALGTPNTYVQASPGMVTRIADFGDDGYEEIEIDAAIRPGNSGGPLVNTADQVVGIVVSKRADEKHAYAASAEEVQGFLSTARGS